LVVTKNTHTTEIQSEVLKVLTYFGIFRHPLLFSELHAHLLLKISKADLLAELNLLHSENKLQFYNNYYFLNDDVTCIEKRIVGEEKAQHLLPKAIIMGKVISYFPFVKFVGISGSLSKGYADAKTDFDFFIITNKNRLWICRTLLHLFKKLTFLVGKQHYFCMNYFVDETAMEIEDKNIFAMYELATLIPVYNANMYNQLMDENRWVVDKLPQYQTKPFDLKPHDNILKKVSEFFLNLLPTDNINDYLMKITDSKWKSKWASANYPMDEYDLAFRTKINISKNHPKNHQKLVLSKLSKFL